eukprot:60504_1
MEPLHNWIIPLTTFIGLCLSQVVIKNAANVSVYDVMFTLYNAEDSSCTDSINNVQIWSTQFNEWINYDASFNDAKHILYEWHCNHVAGCAFVLPISVLLSTVQGNPITLTNIITNYNQNSWFNTTCELCHGTETCFGTTPAPSASSSICSQPGMIRYGTQHNCGNGFDISLYIYCSTETVQLTIDYRNYSQNWFGIVFNKQMTPSPNSTIFTTGKPTENQRNASLYSYDITGKTANSIIYHSERDWIKLIQIESNNNLSILYEQQLKNTKWDIHTKSITFRYAFGSALQLTQHSASDYSQIITFNLVADRPSTLNPTSQPTSNPSTHQPTKQPTVKPIDIITSYPTSTSHTKTSFQMKNAIFIGCILVIFILLTVIFIYVKKRIYVSQINLNGSVNEISLHLVQHEGGYGGVPINERGIVDTLGNNHVEMKQDQIDEGNILLNTN